MTINKAEVKRLILEASNKHHGDRFTRIGADVYKYFDKFIQSHIDEFVKKHPMVGKTITSAHVDYYSNDTSDTFQEVDS